ncbi:ABC transporter ATP-binding protein [Oceaniglobus trochenteri]|uniref:ABC transporter ATP-binding protein n=1 Tax=Oceaniglobus trochenteri TaxID=2763260 RepID=UPI001D001848|nr:oligopeptide/dipeptide ABC transporter ATP-binding protein [Oceaniglobus trochenteri]
MTDDTILSVADLSLRFGAKPKVKGSGLLAVNKVSFDLKQGETLSIVGESGSGKTTIGRCIARLYAPSQGSMVFQAKDGPVDLATLDKAGLRKVRREIQMLFQDPNASLNSRMRIGEIVAEPLEIHGIGTKAERIERVRSLLERVGLSADAVNRYPHQLSGGQRQRVGIARALTISPRLLICDEPVSALDVSVQAQVLNLLGDLQKEMGLTYIFVSHDLGVVDYISDRIMVLYLGTVMELATRDDLFAAPAHPYTRALLDAMPARVGGKHRKRKVLSGEIGGPSGLRKGCVFAGRCPFATDICRTHEPELRPWRRRPETRVACHHADDLDLGSYDQPPPEPESLP